MTVKELIEKLAEFPNDMEVMISDDGSARECFEVTEQVTYKNPFRPDLDNLTKVCYIS